MRLRSFTIRHEAIEAMEGDETRDLIRGILKAHAWSSGATAFYEEFDCGCIWVGLEYPRNPVPIVETHYSAQQHMI